MRSIIQVIGICTCSGKYISHQTPVGAIVAPKDSDGERVVRNWKFHYNGVGQNRNPGVLRRSDTRNPRGIPQQSLGVARLRTPTWQVGATKKRGGREKK